MKNSLACPKCDTADLWVIDEVHQPVFQLSNERVPMVVHAVRMDLEDSAFNRWLHPNPYQRMVAGKFEAWVCASCGYTEWYAKEMNQELKKMAALPGSGVRRISRPEEREPFR